MKIQKDTRRLILSDLIARGDIVGELEPSEFVRKVFPDAENMSSEDHRYTTFLKEVWKHMEVNNDWTWDYVLFHRLNLLEADDDKFILFLEQYVSVSNLPIFGHFCHPIFAHKSTKKAAEASSWIGMRKMV